LPSSNRDLHSHLAEAAAPQRCEMGESPRTVRRLGFPAWHSLFGGTPAAAAFLSWAANVPHWPQVLCGRVGVGSTTLVRCWQKKKHPSYIAQQISHAVQQPSCSHGTQQRHVFFFLLFQTSSQLFFGVHGPSNLPPRGATDAVPPNHSVVVSGSPAHRPRGLGVPVGGREHNRMLPNR